MAVSRSRDEDQQLGSTLDSRLHHGRDPTIHAVRHPPIELAGLRPRDRLHPDRRIDFLAICFGSGRSTHGVGALGLLQPDQEVRTELDRWFFSVAGSVDAITAGVLLALARRTAPDPIGSRTGSAVIVAGAIILPFQPTYAAILAIGVVPLIAY